MKLLGRFKTQIVIIVLGLIYLIIIKLTRFTIPCLFNLITGWDCPGCGITTLFFQLSKLNFKRAFHANQFIFITLPFLIFEVIYTTVLSEKKIKNPKWNEILLYIYIGLLVIWGIVRNIMK